MSNEEKQKRRYFSWMWIILILLIVGGVDGVYAEELAGSDGVRLEGRTQTKTAGAAGKIMREKLEMEQKGEVYKNPSEKLAMEAEESKRRQSIGVGEAVTVSVVSREKIKEEVQWTVGGTPHWKAQGNRCTFTACMDSREITVTATVDGTAVAPPLTYTVIKPTKISVYAGQTLLPPFGAGCRATFFLGPEGPVSAGLGLSFEGVEIIEKADDPVRGPDDITPVHSPHPDFVRLKEGGLREDEVSSYIEEGDFEDSDLYRRLVTAKDNTFEYEWRCRFIIRCPFEGCGREHEVGTFLQTAKWTLIKDANGQGTAVEITVGKFGSTFPSRTLTKPTAQWQNR